MPTQVSSKFFKFYLVCFVVTKVWLPVQFACIILMACPSCLPMIQDSSQDTDFFLFFGQILPLQDLCLKRWRFIILFPFLTENHTSDSVTATSKLFTAGCKSS